MYSIDDLKVGEKLWVLRKGEFQQRTISMIGFPYSIQTALLEGEPTQDPRTGMFICSKYFDKLETGKTKKDLMSNLMTLELQRIERETAAIEKSRKRLKRYQKLTEALNED